MKRLVVVLGGLLALPAFAEVAPFYYTDAIEYADEEYADDDMIVDDAELVAEEEKPVVVSKPSPRITPATRVGSRAGVTTANVSSRRVSDTNSRVIAARTTTTPSRTTVSRGAIVSRGTVNNSGSGVATRRVSGANANVARAGTTTAVLKTTSGKTEDTFEKDVTYTGRVGVRSGQTAARIPTIRVASATMTTSSDTSTSTNAETTNAMNELVEMTDYCKAQYTACMDNFCNVLDDNQGRCSCSKNLKNYAKTEAALKAATEELQDVAQKIQYIGLTADEITTLFSETAAEEAMRSASDSSRIKTSLDKIKNMIVDVKSGSASNVADSGMSFDLSNLLDFTISSTGFDLSALFGTATNDTSSIANQRGETLYKTASARCKANILNTCVAQGVDASVITNSYDLEIDKQCIAYERSLSDSNDEMSSTVRNAKTVLQKARLMVAQQKNQYDMRGCVSALDSCMQDDFVCGADYENCLDPSGKYIVNGAVVVGSLPGKPLTDASTEAGMFKNGLYNTWVNDGTYAWDYDGNSGDLSNYISATLGKQTQTDTNMSKFLQFKIGYNEDGKNYGMCMSVLNKCQDYSYTGANKTYNPSNNVIKEYLYRTMVQIKAAQDTLLANYAETCVSDVASCLATNNYSNSDISKNIAVNACKSMITTCMSVNGDVTTAPNPSQMLNWADGVYSGTIMTTSGS